MKYAVDRYAIGTEKEVSADDFDGQLYIPGRRNRFFCPECGEIVYFRAKGGKNPNHFYHQEKTDQSPECDKRVDGRLGQSLNERIGLPLFLTTHVPGRFELNIGFPSLGEEMLNKAVAANYKVQISSGSKSRSINVDPTNFIEDSMTLVPVVFVPPKGSNYSITINGEKSIFGLKQKWSNYADGFDLGGAIFTYDESCGKKIRRGDSISTNRSYYAVIRNPLPSHLNIQQTEIGKLIVEDDTFGVYQIEINVSLDDKNAFSRISQYFKRYFGIWLLEKQPELIPLWPPVIQQDCYVPVSNRNNVICAISSGNTTPNVYVYSEYGVSNKTIGQEYNNIKTVEIVAGKRPITLSVDRKYVGREISFLSKEVSNSKYCYDIGVGKELNSFQSLEKADKNLLSSEYFFFSNSKMELYAGTRDKQYRHITIREKATIVPAMKNTTEICLVVGSALIKKILCYEKKSGNINTEELVNQFLIAKRGRLVPIPRWADHIIRSLKKSHDNMLLEAIASTTTNGLIYVDSLTLLRKMMLETNNLIK